MITTRRQLLGAGACAGLLATTTKASTLSEIVASLEDKPVPAPVPAAPAPHYAMPAPVSAQPRVIVDAAIDPRLLGRARAAFDRHRHSLRHTDTVGIVDYSRLSREPRFYLFNTGSGQVTSHLVAHGRGSDPDHSGFVERFSNNFGSHASSNGAYTTAETYEGKYGLSMKVNGLDWSNNNAMARAIVIHNAWYAEDDMIPLHGKLGRSEGCFAFSRKSQWDVMHRLGEGRLIYAEKIA